MLLFETLLLRFIKAFSDNTGHCSIRFATAVKRFSILNPFLIFSGDCLNPSALSTITKGKPMISVLNELGVCFTVFGK